MERTYSGHVHDCVIVIDEPCAMPEGAKVQVRFEEPLPFEPDWDKAWAQAGTARDVEGRSDVAARADEILAEAMARETARPDLDSDAQRP